MWDKLVLYLLSECTYRQKVQMQRSWSMHVPVIGADMAVDGVRTRYRPVDQNPAGSPVGAVSCRFHSARS